MLRAKNKTGIRPFFVRKAWGIKIYKETGYPLREKSVFKRTEDLQVSFRPLIRKRPGIQHSGEVF